MGPCACGPPLHRLSQTPPPASWSASGVGSLSQPGSQVGPPALPSPALASKASHWPGGLYLLPRKGARDGSFPPPPRPRHRTQREKSLNLLAWHSASRPASRARIPNLGKAGSAASRAMAGLTRFGEDFGVFRTIKRDRPGAWDGSLPSPEGDPEPAERRPLFLP